MKTFLESSATRVLLIVLAGQLLKDILPMVQAEHINLWKLAEGQIVILFGLVGNALRPDINAPGFNFLNPKEPKG